MSGHKIIFEKSINGIENKGNADYDAVQWWIIRNGNLPEMLFKDGEYYAVNGQPIVVYNGLSGGQRVDISFHQPNAPQRDQKTNSIISNTFIIYTAKGTIEFIRAFVEKCKNDYLLYKNNRLGNQLWYFEHLSSGWKEAVGLVSGQEANITKNHIVFTKKPFQTNKNFNNIFYEDKDSVKEAIDNFKNGAETYAKLGKPYNFGAILYGPPGSGKTSTAKATAIELKRHVINVRFSEIHTNAQLDNLFNNEIVYVYDQELNKIEKIVVPVPSRMLIVEDFDAMGSILLKRSTADKKKEVAASKKDAKEENEENKLDLSEISNLLSEETKIVDSSASLEDYFGAESKRIVKHVKKNGEVPEDNGSKEDDKKNDKVTLATLLNILDGPYEVYGRVIFMTTNYIEKLDEAIIRPGRVDRVIKLGLCSRSTIMNMFTFFFPNVQFHPNAFDSIVHFKISPALVNQILFNNLNSPNTALTEIIEKTKKRKKALF
jgi:hypothetical protein